MSFTIDLMRNNSPKEQVNKNLSNISTVTGTLKNQTSIIDPVINIQGDVGSFVRCNYMRISEFGRYYFVTNIRSLTNDVFEISGHVDVLMTYRDAIISNSAIIRRQESDWNLYLNDGSFKIYQNPIVLTRLFPSGFSTQEFVLAVAGS